MKKWKFTVILSALFLVFPGAAQASFEQEIGSDATAAPVDSRGDCEPICADEVLQLVQEVLTPRYACTRTVEAPRVAPVSPAEEAAVHLIAGRGSVTCNHPGTPYVSVCIEPYPYDLVALGCTESTGKRSASATAHIPCVPGSWMTSMYSFYSGVNGAPVRIHSSPVTVTLADCAPRE